MSSPYWLSPVEGKKARSVAFLIAIATEAQMALKGLRLAGAYCNVVKKEPFTASIVCSRY